MAQETIDLRSDTVTRPTPEMRRVMADAEVGDDVLGDDPSVIRLQERFAEIMGKEAACFVPSGTMGNLAAIRALTEPGDEIIAHYDSHFYHYECGSFAAVAGCSVRFLQGARGQFDASDVEANIRHKDVHFPRTRLVIVENTANRGGGSIWPLERVQQIRAAADRAGLRCHLDGARIWNASVATGLEPREYAQHFDTVTACFSKGLGGPVGSAIACSGETIQRVFRFRKMFGGTMRQSGILAAAALYALDHHIERLAEDHANARLLGQRLADIAAIRIDPAAVETNIVYFDVEPDWGTAQALADQLEAAGVRMFATGPQRLRAVTHLDVNSPQIERAGEIIAMKMRTSATV